MTFILPVKRPGVLPAVQFCKGNNVKVAKKRRRAADRPTCISKRIPNTLRPKTLTFMAKLRSVVNFWAYRKHQQRLLKVWQSRIPVASAERELQSTVVLRGAITIFELSMPWPSFIHKKWGHDQNFQFWEHFINKKFLVFEGKFSPNLKKGLIYVVKMAIFGSIWWKHTYCYAVLVTSKTL